MGEIDKVGKSALEVFAFTLICSLLLPLYNNTFSLKAFEKLNHKIEKECLFWVKFGNIVLMAPVKHNYNSHSCFLSHLERKILCL